MKKMMNLKKGIAVLLTAVIAVSGFAISNVYAARAIDTERTCTVSVDVTDLSKDESKADLDRVYNTKQLSSVDFSVNLYKVANVSKSAVYNLTKDFKGVTDVDGKEITALSSVTAEEWINIVDKASSIVANYSLKPECTIDIKEGNGIITGVDVGLYLVEVPKVETDTEIYTFNNYLIQLPYVEGSWQVNEAGEYAFVGEDEWIYDVALNWASKYERTDRLTKIEIEKTVDVFNTSLNQTSFVYSIVAEKNYGVDTEKPQMVKVFDDVRAIDFSEEGTKSIVVDKIPVGSVVTVKEVYSGATYVIAENSSNVVKIMALKELSKQDLVPTDQKASFENTYNNKLIGNGTAVVNTFTKGETGWNWSRQKETKEPNDDATEPQPDAEDTNQPVEEVAD